MLCVWALCSAASSKTISGLLEFDSKTQAVEVLTVLNHYQIRIPSESQAPPLVLVRFGSVGESPWDTALHSSLGHWGVLGVLGAMWRIVERKLCKLLTVFHN